MLPRSSAPNRTRLPLHEGRAPLDPDGSEIVVIQVGGSPRRRGPRDVHKFVKVAAVGLLAVGALAWTGSAMQDDQATYVLSEHEARPRAADTGRRAASTTAPSTTTSTSLPSSVDPTGDVVAGGTDPAAAIEPGSDLVGEPDVPDGAASEATRRSAPRRRSATAPSEAPFDLAAFARAFETASSTPPSPVDSQATATGTTGTPAPPVTAPRPTAPQTTVPRHTTPPTTAPPTTSPPPPPAPPTTAAPTAGG
jgi:hypothetical protein